MNIDVTTTTDGVIHVSVTGELDMATAGDLQKVLRQATTRSGTTRILVDFAQVGFCDSSGLDVLDRAYGEAAAKQIPLRMVNPPPMVRRILDLVGMLDTLTGP
ncbi:STAS domain-containing protein [Actinoplanes utahensis]|uniref:STAS domain-containing protein n=1 Tax=Actinoplanes utahensis TaxID=1869 RepID=UPI00068A9691|nr:STAS domain-containing protein [Actinoplanes utahensis]GIF33879.1 anti-sigma factor antagonist [Actinoplanes utahensis]